jgi:CBS domain containing-hemolysin-like protein
MLNSFLLIILLIAISAFFSVSEISLAASRKIKLKQMADEGNVNAKLVMQLQENPGIFFTVVQIGVNAVAILGGIVGDTALSPFLEVVFKDFMPLETARQLAFICSFSVVTGLFILFADLTPKRIGMVAPEALAVHIIKPMRFCLLVFRPLVWFFNGAANVIFRIFNLPMGRNDDLTSDDIYAVFEAGASSGALRKQEHELIENVFELESKTVPSSMTARENIIYFDLNESESEIKDKIANYPHSKFLVCDGAIDHIVGYVDSKDLLIMVLSNQSLTLKNGVQINTPLIIPDSLTLSDTLESFKVAGEDFAIILNEYALVVGIITLKDVMTTLMGDVLGPGQEEQIVARDEDSWLIEGITPIDDIMRVLDIDEFPHSDSYETIGGFMMYMLRKIPKRTDYVKLAGYKFEVVDIDSYKIDQLLVTRINSEKTVAADTADKAAPDSSAEQNKEHSQTP